MTQAQLMSDFGIEINEENQIVDTQRVLTELAIRDFNQKASHLGGQLGIKYINEASSDLDTLFS